MTIKMKNRLHRYDINRPRSSHEHNIVNIRSVSLWLWLHTLSNTLETFEAQFIKKFSNTEA